MQTYLSPSPEVGQVFVPASLSCPSCKVEMRFVHATSIAFTPGLFDVSYTCNECGREQRGRSRNLIPLSRSVLNVPSQNLRFDFEAHERQC